MTKMPDHNAEPEWVKRLRDRGFEVEGGEGGDLPMDPPAALDSLAPPHRSPYGFRTVLDWFQRRRKVPSHARRHAPVP